MNPYLAIALGTVALIVAVALWYSGYVIGAVVAVVAGSLFDVMFVLALRKEQGQRRR
ncbi:MAG: hypothetical protein U1F48_10955 [Burkholderiales bacterium]